MALSPVGLHDGSVSYTPRSTSAPKSTTREQERRRTKRVLPSGAEIAAALTTARPSAKKLCASLAHATETASASLVIARQEGPSETTLFFTGDLEATTIGKLRDAAFTEIGLRPALLRLDLTCTELPDAPATEALVTIGSVARMMGVPLCVRVSPPLAALLQQTQLSRLIPMETVACDALHDAADGAAF